MQLVIDIHEKDYQSILNGFVPSGIVYAVMDGTPLPKGHGDLIDRRELKKEVHTTTEWNGDVHRIIYESSVDDAKPIIEADKED